MAVNYSLLKESEMEVMTELNNFYEHIINIAYKLYEFLNNDGNVNSSISHEQYEHIEDMTRHSYIIQNDLLSNCIWVIQKNEPRASHLRFIVAVIYSIKNLLNISECIRKVSKFFYKNKTNIKLMQEFLIAYKTIIELSKKISSTLIDEDIYNINETLKEEFNNYYKTIKQLIQHSIVENEKIKNNYEYLIDFIINIKKLSLILSLQENIINEFLYIKPNRKK